MIPIEDSDDKESRIKSQKSMSSMNDEPEDVSPGKDVGMNDFFHTNKMKLVSNQRQAQTFDYVDEIEFRGENSQEIIEEAENDDSVDDSIDEIDDFDDVITNTKSKARKIDKVNESRDRKD